MYFSAFNVKVIGEKEKFLKRHDYKVYAMRPGEKMDPVDVLLFDDNGKLTWVCSDSVKENLPKYE